MYTSLSSGLRPSGESVGVFARQVSAITAHSHSASLDEGDHCRREVWCECRALNTNRDCPTATCSGALGQQALWKRRLTSKCYDGGAGKAYADSKAHVPSAENVSSSHAKGAQARIGGQFCPTCGHTFRRCRCSYLCAWCSSSLSEAGTLKKCVACNSMHYCSKDCQAQHWKRGHKQDCARRVEMNKAIGEQATRDMVRWQRLCCVPFAGLTLKTLVPSGRLGSHILSLHGEYSERNRQVRLHMMQTMPVEEAKRSLGQELRYQEVVVGADGGARVTYSFVAIELKTADGNRVCRIVPQTCRKEVLALMCSDTYIRGLPCAAEFWMTVQAAGRELTQLSEEDLRVKTLNMRSRLLSL